MGDLFGGLGGASVVTRAQSDAAYLHRMGCTVCPLAKENTALNPDMKPSGSLRPDVYILGEAPGAEEDKQDLQFVGPSGDMLRARIPRDFKGAVRFNNVVRTRPTKNHTPEFVEIECCRPSITKDIELTRPKAIFGFGNVPLEWVCPSPLQGITQWRGRRMPVRVGTHTCWYYPMLHPAWLLRMRRREDDEGALAVGSEEERMFGFDLKRAFAEIDTLPPAKVHTAQDVWRNLECITEFGRAGLRAVEEGLHWASSQPDIGVDYETNALRPYSEKARILTAAVATGERGVSFAFEHPDAEWSPTELDTVYDLWDEFLRGAKGTKWVHHLGFELEWTGVKVNPKLIRAGKWGDTSVQASVLDERPGKGRPGCFSLEFLVQQYFGFNLKKLSNVDRSKLADTPLELVLRYNGGDARYHCLLGLQQRDRIRAAGLEDVYWDSLRRVPTVVLSQIKGCPVDQEEVKALKVKYEKRIGFIIAKIRDLPVVAQFEKSGDKFSPFSTKDVLHIFTKLLKREECTVWDKRKKRERASVDESVLEQIDHPLAKHVIALRKANKNRSTYIVPLLKSSEHSVVHDDGLIHATFNTIFARTGRLSCDSPNLQNYPARDDEAKEVRKPIKAPPKRVLYKFDYGQIEARVIAMATRDKVFCKALWEDYDIHMEWAERLAHGYPKRIGGKKNLTDKKVMKAFRTDIKNQWTFPLFFGATLSSAAGYLSIPEEVLAPFYRQWWKVFSGVKKWQEGLLDFYREKGYVECLDGRRRNGPLTINQVYNSPVQGTAATIVMDGMCRLSETADPELQPEINIHDDLTYCRIPVERADALAEKIISAMLDVQFDFVNVPITVEMSMGPDWLNTEEIGTFRSDKWFKK